MLKYNYRLPLSSEVLYTEGFSKHEITYFKIHMFHHIFNIVCFRKLFVENTMFTSFQHLFIIFSVTFLFCQELIKLVETIPSVVTKFELYLLYLYLC